MFLCYNDVIDYNVEDKFKGGRFVDKSLCWSFWLDYNIKKRERCESW